MKLRPTYCLLFLLLFLAGCSSVERTVRRGDNALAIGEYAEAAGQYRLAYQRTPSRERERRGELAYKMAEAYRCYGNAARALGSYRSAERYKYTDTLTLLRLGDMQRIMGDYKGALKSYETYSELHPESEEAQRGMLSAEAGLAGKDLPSPYTVRISQLFNSSRSDYCPAFLDAEGSQLYFTSTRRQAQGDLSGITAMKPGDIFFAKKDEKGKWKQPEAAEGALNTDFDEGACCISPDGTKMYLTVCQTNDQYPRMAEIMTSTRSDASWSKPQPLKITADTLSSYAHPAITPDGKWLYFTSDMPGGYGGLDLWRMRLEGKGGNYVENLGPDINTAGNEVFPYFRRNGELYFASNGRTPNFGGLDIYVAQEDTATQTWTVGHLPAPMNSQGDDFGICFEGTHNRGYFSSSRSTGGRGWDKIYEFSYPEQFQTVKGWVYEQDGYELPAAQVYMVGSDGTNKKLSVLSDGSFEQPVTAGVDYLFLATCPGYLNVRAELRPDTVQEEYQHVLQFPLPSMNIPVLLRGIYYQFDKAVLTDSSKVALGRLVALLKENPNVTIELRAHCDYRGGEGYNDRLSQQRAESVTRFLVENGIEPARLTAKGYGEREPRLVSRKIAEAYPFLHAGDTLTEARIAKLPPREQEIANALNRRTEFRVLSATYGLFDEHGNLRPDAIKPRKNEDAEPANDEPVFDDGTELY
ncbi:MAG: OmpA family protein [Prevotella sp.]|nr:OmpA family protein [Prevotella sp.]